MKRANRDAIAGPVFDRIEMDIVDVRRQIVGITNLGRVDKRDSQGAHLLIQDCFLRSSHGPRGFVECGVGVDRAAVAA